MNSPSLVPDAAQFALSNETDWRTLVAKTTKGAPFDRLIGRTADNLPIQPLYAAAKGNLPRAIRHRPRRWAISQRVEHPDHAQANRLALSDLEGGADALTLVFAGAAGDFGFGLDVRSTRHFDEVLAGVDIDLISLRLDSPGNGLEQANHAAGLVAARRLVASRQTLDFGCDPIGAMLRAGAGLDTSTQIAEFAARMGEKGFAGGVFMADGRCIHAAGGSQAQELAHVIGSGLHYLRALEREGLTLNDARSQISFLLTADTDQFTCLVKFRAMRLLWARLEQACGLVPKPIQLHAETAWRMLTRRDCYVNVLRTTAAIFAAGVGGADAITALPFTTAIGLPDANARRIARNAHLVLLDEAHLADVDDPAAGAGGFEALTQGLCETAWALFQASEAAGGILQALASGLPQSAIAASAHARAKALATRKLPLTGTTEFPDLMEKAADVLLSPLEAAMPNGLPRRRDAEPFEALRDAADAFAAAHGAKPLVFLANLGPPAGFSARAGFAINAFAAGGIEATRQDCFANGDGTTDLAALSQAAQSSGAQLACLCGADTSYEREVEAAAHILSPSFTTLFLAGRPPVLPDARLHYIHAGADILAALQVAHAGLSGSKA